MQKSVAQWQKDLNYWTQQARDNERYWGVLRWFPLGMLFAVPVAFLHLPLAGLIAVSVFITWITGYYMTTVRRYEFRHNIEETQRELDAARQGSLKSAP